MLLFLVLAVSIHLPVSRAETEADIHLNVRHSVGGVSQFDRQKFMTVHSNLSEPDWVGEDEKLDYLLNDLDVYMGRDNGNMLLYIGEADEDPNRPGYVDPDYMTVAGKIDRKVIYGTKLANRHRHDHKNDVMIGGQASVFWPGQNTRRDGTGWKLAGADAMGEFMGRYLNSFYREEGESPKNGPARPQYLEVVNEPLYALIDGHRGSTVHPQEIFDFHNDMATAVRKFNDTVLIGGYTAAFPIFEERDFARWNERMKRFIDTCGEQMDFFSVHFYDFNNRGDRGRDDYKGARIEATFDMMEQYSRIRLGEVKPFIISEYGGRDHKLENRSWTAIRDWHFLKAASPLLMSFLDRPNLILKTLPFITAKAEWGRKNGVPYNRRLLHQAKERPGQTGDEWVFTDLVLFYELWRDVEGTRAVSASNNPDVLVDCYVDGRKAYVILSNLNPSKEVVSLNLFDKQKTNCRSVKVKHLYRAADAAKLDVEEQTGLLREITLDPEATAIIEFTFDRNIGMEQTAEERKHYATEYYKPIRADQPIRFEIDGVHTDKYGETVLRVGFGRKRERSRQPVVIFNGATLNAPANYSGSEQATRPAFFGLLEIPVPYHLVDEENRISVSFPDTGGHVSSVALQVLEFSEPQHATDGDEAVISK